MVTSFGSPSGKVLYLVVCAVTGADRTVDRIAQEQANGWDVCVVATERSLHWFDAEEAEQVSGHALQTRMRVHGEPLFQPLGDQVLVAPGGFNSISKFALGLADDMPSGLVCEAIGRGVPVTIEVQVGPGFAGHPILGTHLDALEAAGVELVFHTEDPRP